MKKPFLFFFLIVLVCSSCMSYSDEEKKHYDAIIQRHVDSLHLQMNHFNDGLYYKIIKEGTGNRKIEYNDKVTFYYTGSFLNGKVFQKKTKKEALTFKVNELIAGWQEALMLIKEGGQIQVIIPPQLGYGDKKTELIPANSVLVYDLTVVKVQ